jgi:hypothetical protein
VCVDPKQRVHRSIDGGSFQRMRSRASLARLTAGLFLLCAPALLATPSVQRIGSRMPDRLALISRNNPDLPPLHPRPAWLRLPQCRADGHG